MPKHHHTQNWHILMECGSTRLLMTTLLWLAAKEVTNHNQTSERTGENTTLNVTYLMVQSIHFHTVKHTTDKQVLT